MMELVTGGSGSGKSAYAEMSLCSISRPGSGGRAAEDIKENTEEKKTEQRPPLYYIATMPSWDKETEKKIERHRVMRSGKGFLTLEWYTDLEGRLKSGDCPPMKGAGVLVECLSNLTANEMYMESGAGEGAAEAVVRGIMELKRRCAHLVVVTNDVFAESASDTPEMRQYKENLGKINQVLAGEADRVTEVVRGIPCTVKKPAGAETLCTEEQGETEISMQTERKDRRHVKIITGGAYQGKLAYARRLYPGMTWTDGKSCRLDEIGICSAVYAFHEFVKRWLEAGRSSAELTDFLLEETKERIIVCDEIGCGLVPVDAFEREYREETGRIMTALAERAERVDRVVCGIGTRIR